MNRFQLAGYFKTEGESWTWVTQEGYVSVLHIDTDFDSEKALEKEALERYAKLQKRWRLSSYEELIAREGAEKARANLMLRFYEDALESFKPKSRRDIRALYALFALIVALPFAIFFFLNNAPEFDVDVNQVKWLPDYTSIFLTIAPNKFKSMSFRLVWKTLKLGPKATACRCTA